jgi:DNA-binding winged helix-turn-helix (wHTH) protein/tetratricopeptide (TPR) repeat protein
LTSQRAELSIYEFGPFLMDSSARRLFLNGHAVHLTAKLFDILLRLVQRSGEVVSKEELMREIWPDQFVEDSNLTVCVCMLRKVLGEKNGERGYIETVPKRGYRFVARVRELKVTDQAEGGHTHASGGGRKDFKREKAAVSLAVLPIIAKGRSPNLEYLSDGLTESLINSLSQISQMRVLARSTVFRYKAQYTDALKIGQELNVRVILAGRVLQLNDSLLISVELIDVSDGVQLWGANYNCQFSNIFEVQEEITRTVSEKLQLRLTLLEKGFLTRRYTESTEAYRNYLKGRFFWNKRSIKGIKGSINYFQKAIGCDASYALAYSGLADGYITLADYGVVAPCEVVPHAEAAVRRALEIDGKLAEAHTSSANLKKYSDQDFARAEEEYLRAIELNPYYATAHHWYADYLAKMGRFDESIERIKQGLEIDPLSLIISKTMAKVLYLARKYDEAVKQCLETFELDPNFGPASGQLAYIYAAQGRYDEAISEIQKLINFTAGDYEVTGRGGLKSIEGKGPRVIFSESDPEAIGALGSFYALAGRRDEAEELLSGLMELSRRRYVEPHTLAMIYIGLGDKDRAFEWLEKSYSNRSSVLKYLKVWPVLDTLRADPRLVDLCRRVGFRA